MPSRTSRCQQGSVRPHAGIVAWLAGLLLVPGAAGALDLRLVSIATGPTTGVYYFAGGSICDLVNEGRWQHGIRCVARPSGGSIGNLRALRNAEATMAIVQSDWQAHAVEGTGVFEGIGPDQTLRSLFALYPEPFTLVARPEAGIARFSDLLGKRINAGSAGSGSRATMEIVMAAMGWTEADLGALTEIDTDDLPQALCEGEIDAAVFIIAHPNLTVEEMMTSCGARLVPVEGPGIDLLIEEIPSYFQYAIAGGTYPSQPVTVPVFALAATLVTPSQTPPSVVYEVTATVLGNLDTFRKLHPAFADFSIEQMLSDGLTAPFHSGALRYFEEAGLR